MKLYNEALRLHTVYMEHKDSEDAMMRRRAVVELDRFLMENREVCIQAMLAHLSPKRPWYKRKPKKIGVVSNANSHQVNS